MTVKQLMVGLGTIAVALLLLSGCGGDWCDDEWCEDDYPSPQKTIFLYLNVADEDGNPLPNVTVWVAGSQQDEKTDDEYSRLGTQFPPEWQGWEYNWSGGPYWFDVRDCAGDRCDIEILVTRSGYVSQRTYIPLDAWDPDEVYVRHTFVMELRIDASGLEVVETPTQPEKTALVTADR